LGENRLNDFERALLQIELDEAGVGAKRAEVGQQIAQSKRSVNVAGVERGENDLGHDAEIINVK